MKSIFLTFSLMLMNININFRHMRFPSWRSSAYDFSEPIIA